MVERKIDQFSLEPSGPQDHQGFAEQARLPTPSQTWPTPEAVDNGGQAKSFLEGNRLGFLKMAMDGNLHLTITRGISRNVRERQNDILARRKEGEGFESIGRGYGSSANWAETQFEQGLKRLWNNSPEGLQRGFPKEDLFMDRYEKVRETQRKQRNRAETLASQLASEDLNKEQLEEVRLQIGGVARFYKRYRELFCPLETVLKEANCSVHSSADLSSIAAKLEQDSGIVVFSFSTKEGRGVKTHFLISKPDHDVAVGDLSNPNFSRHFRLRHFRPRPSGQVIYRSGF